MFNYLLICVLLDFDLDLLTIILCLIRVGHVTLLSHGTESNKNSVTYPPPKRKRHHGFKIYYNCFLSSISKNILQIIFSSVKVLKFSFQIHNLSFNIHKFHLHIILQSTVENIRNHHWTYYQSLHTYFQTSYF
jgi:hypothetical protein